MIVAVVGGSWLPYFCFGGSTVWFQWQRFCETFTQFHSVGSPRHLVDSSHLCRSRPALASHDEAVCAARRFPEVAHRDSNRLHRYRLSGRPGELIRPYLIAVREKTPFSSQMAIWLLERIWDLLIVLAMFGFA